MKCVIFLNYEKLKNHHYVAAEHTHKAVSINNLVHVGFSPLRMIYVSLAMNQL